MNGLRSMVAVWAILVGGMTAAHGQQILSDYDRQTNFSQYKTYSWQQINAPDNTWGDHIKSDVDGQLAAKGWVRLDKGGDAVLCAIGTNEEAANVEHFNGGWGPGWRWGGWSEPVPFEEGTLVIDIYDAKTQSLVWRGFAEEAVSKKDDKNINKLEKAVSKLFKNFPPKD